MPSVDSQGQTLLLMLAWFQRFTLAGLHLALAQVYRLTVQCCVGPSMYRLVSELNHF